MWAFSSSHCIFSAVDLWLKFPKKDMLQLQPEARVSEFPSIWQTKLENSFWLGVASIKRLASKSIDNGPLSALNHVYDGLDHVTIAVQLRNNSSKVWPKYSPIARAVDSLFLAISSLDARTGFPERTTKCPLNYHRNSIIARDAKRNEGCS